MKYALAIALIVGLITAYAAGDSLSVSSEVGCTAQAATMPAAAVQEEINEARDQRQAIANMRRQIEDLEEANARLRKELAIYQTKEADRIIQAHATPVVEPTEKSPMERTVHVRAYVRSDGTRVQEHWRRAPGR